MSQQIAQGSPNQAPEKAIAFDMARRSLWVFPAWIVASGFIRGLDGALSSALGYALAIGNLMVAASLMAWGARISPVALMGVTLGGFIVRLGALAGIVIAVAQLDFFEPVPIAVTIIASHLGLLGWETRYVSMRLAAPGPVRTPRSDPRRTPRQHSPHEEQT